jgi:hypothetical protein
MLKYVGDKLLRDVSGKYLPGTTSTSSIVEFCCKLHLRDLAIHLAGFKPKENQVVVRSQYRDRWLIFDSFLSLATDDGSVSTVN